MTAIAYATIPRLEPSPSPGRSRDMLAFGDFVLDFRPNPKSVLPVRIARAIPAETAGPGWRVSTQVHVDRRTPPLAHVASEQWEGWAIGDIYRHDDATGSTADCLRAFLRSGMSSPERLAGRFAIAVWDKTERRWSVWTDRVGSVHLYYTAGPGGPVLGTYSPAVYAASGGKLDWAAIGGFFAYGFFPQDRTHIQGVRVMRPAARYDFDSQGREIGRQPYWRWTHSPDTRTPAAEKLEEFHALLARVMEDQTRDGVTALPLSGGLDSRTLAAFIKPGANVLAYSYGYGEASDETAIAGRVAKARGLSFHSHVIRPYLFDRLSSVLSATEGFQDVTQARQADIVDWVGERAEFVLDAHWGDVFCDDAGLKAEAGLSQDAAFRHSVRQYEKRGRNWLFEHLCRSQLDGQSPEQVARGLIRDEFDALGEIADLDFRVKALKTNLWAHRWTLPSLRVHQIGVLPRTPFFDPRIIDYFCTVPVSMVRCRQLQVEFLKRFAPDLARIPWQTYDADLYRYQHYNTWLVPKRLLKKFYRAVSGDGAIQRNWELQFFGPGQWERLERLLLWDRRTVHELVARTSIRGLLDRFSAERSPVDAYTVSMLLTFAAWLEGPGGVSE